jgi:DNA topoisomerase IA
MAHLLKPNVNEALSVDARQVLDLKIGVSFSRFQTTVLLQKYGNLNTKLVSYGKKESQQCVASSKTLLESKKRKNAENTERKSFAEFFRKAKKDQSICLV